MFAKVLTKLSKYDDRGVPFFVWLLPLARNVAIDHMRANRLLPMETVLDPETSSGADMDRGPTVRAALAALPETQRQVVFLRHVAGWTPEEIADRMGRTEAPSTACITADAARCSGSSSASSRCRPRAAPAGWWRPERDIAVSVAIAPLIP